MLTFLWISGCLLPVEGFWTGACDTWDGSHGEWMSLDLEIEARGRRLEASALAGFASRGLFELELQGERAAEALGLSGTIPLEDQDVGLELYAEPTRQGLAGECWLWVRGASQGIPGALELAR